MAAMKPHARIVALAAVVSAAAAQAAGRVIRYVAQVEAGGKAVIGLQEIGPESPLYALKGTDNAILITTADYPSPMLIQGAGAGTRQTSGGLLSDIMSCL